MPLLVLVIAAVILFLYGAKWFARANPKSLVKAGKGLGVGLLLGLAALLVVTGKLVPALAVLAGAAGWGMRLMSLHQFYRTLRGHFAGEREGEAKDDGDRAGEGRSRRSPKGETMAREEALTVLGLTATANDDDVRAAHRRLITSLHPDRGGSDFLAAQINRARDVLLDK